MGLKLGALAAGVGAGYMAADKWKRDSAKRAKPLNEQPGMEPLQEPPRDPTEGMEDGGYADGGMVMCADPRWMKKTR